MTQSYAEQREAERRLEILRLLVLLGGQENEAAIYRAMTERGFGRDTRDAIRADLDHLKAKGCLLDEWLHDALRVVTITERGTDVAHGRAAAEGVKHERWV